MRLNATRKPLDGKTARWSAYRPEEHGYGIVHLGIGNFARAHLLAYTEDALAAAGGDWRVIGASLRGSTLDSQLAPQDYRYTLLEKGTETTKPNGKGSVGKTGRSLFGLITARIFSMIMSARLAPVIRPSAA